jgi:hypothetical protein
MTVFRLSSSGQRLGEITRKKPTHGTTFHLRAENECMHYELVRE